MFSARYFAPRYFAVRYWGRGGGAAPVLTAMRLVAGLAIRPVLGGAAALRARVSGIPRLGPES